MKLSITIKSIAAIILAAALLPGCGKTDISQAGVKTDALDASAWGQSEWISAADAQVAVENDDDRSADGASWFVSTLKNEGKVVSAKWMTSGLGVFEIYVNGTPIGEEILKPGFTHYAKTKRSFTYDVTAAFNPKAGAENVLAAQVTPGWWADKIVTPGGMDKVIGKKCAFRGVLELTYADGTKKLYGTDTENWKAGIAGPVKHASIFDGEDYDARELPGYDTGFLGGTSGRVGDEIVFNGDLSAHPDFEAIKDFIRSRGLQIKYFESYPLRDIGSII